MSNFNQLLKDLDKLLDKKQLSEEESIKLKSILERMDKDDERKKHKKKKKEES
jgi:hypothetical protein